MKKKNSSSSSFFSKETYHLIDSAAHLSKYSSEGKGCLQTRLDSALHLTRILFFERYESLLLQN